jgi:hypothetical protein
MWKYDNRPPTDETTTRVLLYLRAQIIRDGLEGLEHVETLLQLRGCDPGPYRVPSKRHRRFRNNGLRGALLAILRDGPMSARQAGDRLHARYQDMERDRAIASAKYGLSAMLRAGLVTREGWVWRLVR